jgi:hypothetical protein
MAKIITQGPHKGYYTLPGTLIREEVVDENDAQFEAYKQWQLSLAPSNELWHKYSPGPGKKIRGFNKNYLPFIDGFYYVRKNPEIDLRRQLYALETQHIPSTGNTELFNLQLDNVVVPQDWCPYYLEPCPVGPVGPVGWCEMCNKRTTGTTKTIKTTTGQQNENLIIVFYRWLILGLFALILASVIGIAVLPR